ncbi:MAG: hypothetical protein IJ436_05850, partial [Bacteroidaceae bacterium]|nr:hypothetical protein [Bacteroidaceae bacterium]
IQKDTRLLHRKGFATRFPSLPRASLHHKIEQDALKLACGHGYYTKVRPLIASKGIRYALPIAAAGVLAP